MGLTPEGALGALGGLPGVLDGLLEGNSLSVEDAELVMDQVFDGDAEPSQVAALLIALRAKGETTEELTGMVRSMVSHALLVDLATDTMDIVGTGGDGKQSVNISTMTALVVAGAGVVVCKHGNRAASSMVGTADVFEELGVRIELTPAEVRRCVDEAGIAFVFAQAFHPAMRFVAPVRRALGVRTAFNFLGPLSNPARPSRMLVGTGDRSASRRMAEVLGANGIDRAWVVHSDDGFDELSSMAPSAVIEVVGTGEGTWEVAEWVVDPSTMGFAPATVEDLRGGDAATNARIIHEVLDGTVGPVRDVVLLNASASLVIAGVAPSLEEGLVLAATSLDTGAARASLDRLVAVTNA